MSRPLMSHLPDLRWQVFRGLAWLIPRIDLRALRLLAWFVGNLTWLVDARGRKTVGRNLRPLVPPWATEAHARAVRRSYVHFCLSIAETAWLPYLPPGSFAPPTVKVHDAWNVLYRSPPLRPVIFATVHMNWEFGLGVISRLGPGQGAMVLSLSSGDERIDALFQSIRERLGISSKNLDQAPLASLRHLRGGGVLALVAERDYQGTGMTVQLCDRQARLPIGPAALAVQTGAAIVPCFIVRDGPGRFRIVFAKPLLAAPGVTKSAEVRRLTQELADRFTRFLRTTPAQWVAFHDYWPDEPDRH